jgi:ABC-type transport system involved in multi-copper enzyme maturation permease subunit
MGELFLELGKSILTLGNMMGVLVFFKSYWETGEKTCLYFGILSIVGCYSIAAICMIVSTNNKKEKYR